MRASFQALVIASFAVLCVVLATGALAVEPPAERVARDSCVTAECHADVKSFEHLHGPVYVNACDSCHVLTDVASHEYELARPAEEICVFCHVVETPEDMLVHEPYGAGACLSCHDPHGSASPAMLRGRRYDDLCNTCHLDVTGARELVHGPAGAGACGACHEPHMAANENLLAETGRDLCLRCHVTTGIEIDTMNIVHEPVRSECLMCHDPHATNLQAMLPAEPVELCTSCHVEIAEVVDTATTQHAAVTQGQSCMNCHAAHASDHAGMLEDTSISLCFSCHDREIELEGGRTLQNIKHVIETGTSLHGPVARDNCVACHEIHGGGHKRLLTDEYPSELYYPFAENAYSLCFACHDKQAIMVERTDTLTAFRNGDLNLHYVHVNRDEKGRTCKVCHDAHAADRDHHIRDEIPFGPKGWMLPINFESLPDGGTCAAGCHRAFEYNRVDPVAYPSGAGDESWKGTDLVPGVRAEPADGAGRKRR